MESKYFILLIFVIVIYKYCNMSAVVYESYTKHNGEKGQFLVRDTTDKHDAVIALSEIEKNLNNLIKILINDKECINNKEMFPFIQKINEKLQTVEIQETPADSKYTSYSVNKGEILVFCIRSKETFKIHNLNELLYVAIHEIAHIGCPEVGHTELFFKINK